MNWFKKFIRYCNGDDLVDNFIRHQEFQEKQRKELRELLDELDKKELDK